MDAASTSASCASSVRWPCTGAPGSAASRYDIELSDDGERWRLVRRIEQARGPTHLHWLPDSEARFVRIVPDDPAVPAPSLDAIEPRDAPTANAFFTMLAGQSPRGRYPRAYVGEQSYWTVFGVDGGRIASLLGEDGAVEPVPGVGALEPFLMADGRVLTWADAQISHSLRDGDLPMPAVHWHLGDLSLDIEAFGAGTPEAAQALARYTVTNRSRRTRNVSLALGWRPFQVNPPTQFLANPGGVSDIDRLEWKNDTLFVGGVARLRTLPPPSGVRLEPFAAGPVAEWLGDSSAGNGVLKDASGFASGVLRYDLRLAPGERRDIAVSMPVAGMPERPTTLAAFARAQRRSAAEWRERLDRVRLTGPGAVADIARTVRSSLGHILVNRRGPALQPGARAYARSWIRDGALTSSALLRLGHEREARDFIRWYAPFQFKNGKVPCCATVRGADPVPENDSDGEFAFAVADLWRYTFDASTARALWPNVRAAVAHMEALRQSERTDANQTPERRAYFGLMPPSISHEGYSDKAAYSYWDDFWTAVGYRSAAALARGLGMDDDAARIAAEGDQFGVDLRQSIGASTAHHGLDVLPGAADRGDVDPTSSTMALSPGGLFGDAPGALPEDLLRRTFERYWRDFTARRDSGQPWDAYTPYEWRNVGALVRLGERDRALQALDFFYGDRRPSGWNQWAEVVLRNPREPRFLGDMPHGWVASDHIRSVLDLFAYEHEGERSLVLAAGVPMSWFKGSGLSIDGLRTPYGRLGWKARLREVGSLHRIEFQVRPLRHHPPGGIVLRGPWPADARVQIDGRTVHPAEAGRLRLDRTPARLRIEWPASP